MILKYGLILIATFFILTSNMKDTNAIFKNSYRDPSAINKAQFEAMMWIADNDNIQEKDHILIVGTTHHNQNRWMGYLGLHLLKYDYPHQVFPSEELQFNETKYAIIDYSWFQMAGQQNEVNMIKQWAHDHIEGSVVYNKDGIEVYKIDKYK